MFFNITHYSNVWAGVVNFGYAYESISTPEQHSSEYINSHTITDISLFLTWHDEHINDDQKDGLHTSTNSVSHSLQGSKFHSSDRLRRVKMTVGQVEYLQDLSNGWLRISDFHISCIGFIFQTIEWYILTSDFYNPLAWQTSVFNLKFRSLHCVYI